jgi:hypothetical protein
MRKGSIGALAGVALVTHVTAIALLVGRGSGGPGAPGPTTTLDCLWDWTTALLVVDALFMLCILACHLKEDDAFQACIRNCLVQFLVGSILVSLGFVLCLVGVL